MLSIRQAARRARRAERARRLAKAFHRIAAREDITAEREARRWYGRITSRVTTWLRNGSDAPASVLIQQAAPFDEFRRWYVPRMIHLAKVGYDFEKEHLGSPRAQSFGGATRQQYAPEIRTDLDLSIDMPPDQVARLNHWLSGRSPGVWKGVTTTTRLKLEKTISEGIQDGLTGPQLADRVQAVFPQYNAMQAKRFARTEVTAGMNNGDQLARYEVGCEFKEWVSTIDRRTRTYATSKFDHLHANGQVVPNNEPFIVSGEKLMFPGDSQLGASAGSIVNCRCCATGSWDDTEVAPLTDPGTKPNPGKESEPPPKPKPKPKPKPRATPKPAIAPVRPAPVTVAPKPAATITVASPVPDIIDAKDWAPPPIPAFPAGQSQSHLIAYAARQRSADALAKINEYRTTMRAIETEMETMRLKLLAELDPLQAQIRAAEAAAESLSAQQVQISARVLGPKKGQAAAKLEMAEVQKQLAIARQAVKDVIAASEKELASFRARIGSLLGNEKRAFYLDDSGSRTQVTAASRKATEQFFQQMHKTQRTSLRAADSIVVNDRGGREFYDFIDINVGDRTSADVVIHEVAHAVEHSNDVGNLSTGFVHSRVSFDAPKQLGSQHDADEVAAEDEFAKGFAGKVLSKAQQKASGAYMGKLYRSGNTEVIALGFQQLFLDPYGFLTSDPEFARYILSVYTGRVGKYSVPPVAP